MKITKQRLKEIIREELVREGKRTRMSMPALSDDDFEPDLPTWEGEPFGEYDLDAENEKAGLGDLQTEPRHEGGTPMERLLNKLLIVSNIGAGEGGAAAARKLGLGGDEEVIAYLDDLLGNQMYKESGLEENITPGVQQLMKHHPDSAAKIKELAGNGYRASEIKRMLNLGYRG